MRNKERLFLFVSGFVLGWLPWWLTIWLVIIVPIALLVMAYQGFKTMHW
jgi:hypothetical protein